MNPKTKDDLCRSCSPSDDTRCCRVESIVSVDERGQMVLPKEVRENAGILPGDKLALICMKRDGKVCCLTLIKVEELEGLIKAKLAPAMNEIFEAKKC